jgi:uncharacterized protein YbaR (Trm112 family)/SAM-dependent methyltransferase
MTLNHQLLEIIADPQDKGVLWRIESGQFFYNPRQRLRYPVRDGFPILLAAKAVTVDESEHQRLCANSQADVVSVAPATKLPPAHVRPISAFEGRSDWYEQVMSDPKERGGLAQSGYDILARLVGPGTGIALDIGCGTGNAAVVLRGLGYQPIGIDLSAGQLSHAVVRLPVALGSAHALPIANEAVGLAYSTFTTASWGDLGASLREIYRVLRPGGRVINIGVHPCFNGGYSQAQADGTVVVKPGYKTGGWLDPSHFSGVVRSQTGGWHWPLSDLLNAFAEVGFQLQKTIEDGPGEPESLPIILGLSAVKPL